MLCVNNVEGGALRVIYSQTQGNPQLLLLKQESRFQVLKIECIVIFFVIIMLSDIFCWCFVIFCLFVFVSKITRKLVFAKNV